MVYVMHQEPGTSKFKKLLEGVGKRKVNLVTQNFTGIIRANWKYFLVAILMILLGEVL